MTDQPTSPVTDAQTSNGATQYASLEDHIREALRDVYDPEIGMNVIQLGLIRGIEIQPENIHVNMILTTPFCPYAPQLMEQVRRTAQEAGGRPTTIELGMEMWDTSMMEEGAGQDWGLFY